MWECKAARSQSQLAQSREVGGEGEESCQLTLNAPEKKTTTTQWGEERAIWGGTAFSDHTVPSSQLRKEAHLTIAKDVHVHMKRKDSVEAIQSEKIWEDKRNWRRLTWIKNQQIWSEFDIQAARLRHNGRLHYFACEYSHVWRGLVFRGLSTERGNVAVTYAQQSGRLARQPH